jgi:alcohol dehydrogenase
VVASLEAAGLTYTVCDAVTKEPTVALLDELLTTIDLQGFDSVVAVGGGSVIDVAKAVALLADFGGHIRDYSGQGKVPGPLSRPLITVPTTAGTGSEISDGSVWVDEAAHTKFLVLSPHICPTVALTDPEMTRSMPRSVTGLSGVDALTHAVESYVSRDASPASELFSLRALGLIAAALPAAYRDGDNLDAREIQQLGATMAMIGGMNAHMGLCHAGLRPDAAARAGVQRRGRARPRGCRPRGDGHPAGHGGRASVGTVPPTLGVPRERRRAGAPGRPGLHRGPPGRAGARDAQQRPVPVQPADRVGR